jgi:hypothetical protein
VTLGTFVSHLLHSLPALNRRKGGYPGTRITRWEAGGDGTRSTLLPLWGVVGLFGSRHHAYDAIRRTPASGSEEGELCASSSIPIRTLIPRAEQRGKKARYEYVGPFIGDKNRYS